jgi:dephospho-CoA kinase
MIRIAITGGIACGKSLVGELISKNGLPVCDADHVAHQLLSAGSSVYNDVRRAFGDEILTRGGEIDRTALGALVFSDDKARSRLNALVHPGVQREWDAWLAEQMAAGSPAAAVLVPLLFEADMAGGWDTVVCVACSRQTQLARLAQRGLSPSDALQRLAAQAPVAEKMIRADVVIFNDGSKRLLKRQVEIVLRHMLGADYGQRSEDRES